MERTSTSMSGHSRFLDLPAELRNRIYDFVAETQADQPRCVLPCLALAQVCQQLRTEYRPICMKRDIIIDWDTVPDYMRTFFPTVNGKIENVELTPLSMTIVTPWRGGAGDYKHELDILPILKIGLCQPNFTCNFIHDVEHVEVSEAKQPIGLCLSEFLHYLDEDTTPLETLMGHRNVEWVQDIKTGRVIKILISNIGASQNPQALFYVDVSDLGLEDDMEELGTTIDEVYFKRVGFFDI